MKGKVIKMLHKSLLCLLALLPIMMCCKAQNSDGADPPMKLKSVSLYNDKDQVVELSDDTIEQIFNSRHVWVVEFYAHWQVYIFFPLLVVLLCQPFSAFPTRD